MGRTKGQAMTTRAEMDAILIDLSKRLTDEGKLIEAGWIGLRKVWLDPETPPDILELLRMAFMAGASHLFASINSIMDPGDEPSDRDLDRMSKIHEELQVFGDEMQLRLARAKGRS